ncbi:hypothetical protein M0657_007783 [Pyricularia oryzae]|uniref:Uncharacterized protein n=1 Tax=Pyricularia oryzae TaxID=318829 RepID=A0A4P7N9L2_PYROR|nr:hypothetical protein M9X92_007501 [Pyricularia oryzae]KAI7918044.1 hypothetical protein M0657_007783 [Pyricularia oryzae]QBZ56834.1 hypothetical protein PoMZ_01751 [Pyricularia oryzae]
MRDQGARMGREEAKPTKELSSSLTVDATLGYGRGERNEICTIHHYYLGKVHKALAAEKTSLTQYSMEFGTTPYWCDNFSGSIATHRPCALTTGATGGTFWPLGTLEAETSAPPFWTCMSLCENRCLEA